MVDASRLISQLLTDGTQRIEAVSDSPLLDCQLLICHIIGKGREWLYSHADETLAESQAETYATLLARRERGEPLAYITGSRHFWRRDFRVTPATLIPRPATELLVETILARRGKAALQVLDLGTGSGAIAISLAAERPAWSVTAVDRSAAALVVAAGNAVDLKNIRFCQGHWCDGLAPDRFDIIVSNPPYVANADPHLKALTFEPQDALKAGMDGLDCVREIVQPGYDCLRRNGLLMIEHGYDQQAEVAQLFADAGFSSIECLTDLGSVPRAVLGLKHA